MISSLFTAIITAITAFFATNIDDIVILLLFFSQLNTVFNYRHIVIGQYVGFILIIITSLVGFFSSLIVPQQWIGLLGILPIAIGLSNLLNPETNSSEEIGTDVELNKNSLVSSFMSPQTYSIAAVTLANGSDNISVYIPLFSSSNVISVVIIISVFLLLVGVLCYATYKLTSQPQIVDVLTRYGNKLVPFILIALGVFIVLESQALSLLKLTASCCCLAVLVKNN
jgi:cadmium resistance transport/sequestration family protein